MLIGRELILEGSNRWHTVWENFVLLIQELVSSSILFPTNYSLTRSCVLIYKTPPAQDTTKGSLKKTRLLQTRQQQLMEESQNSKNHSNYLMRPNPIPFGNEKGLKFEL